MTFGEWWRSKGSYVKTIWIAGIAPLLIFYVLYLGATIANYFVTGELQCFSFGGSERCSWFGAFATGIALSIGMCMYFLLPFFLLVLVVVWIVQKIKKQKLANRKF